MKIQRFFFHLHCALMLGICELDRSLSKYIENKILPALLPVLFKLVLCFNLCVVVVWVFFCFYCVCVVFF